MSDLERRLARLTPAQRRLLEARLGRRDQGAPTAPVIPTVTGHDPAPLSFGQQRQWFLQQLVGDGAVHNKHGAYRLRGPLDVDALRRTLATIQERHAVLRAAYTFDGDTPLQQARAGTPFTLPIVDLSERSEPLVEAELRARLEAALQRPFDLAQPPLWRHLLVRLGPDDHVLLRVMHHIVSDRWSVGVVHREMTALYAAFRAGERSPLKPLPFQYADFAVWQRQALSGGALEAQLAYWREQLADPPPHLQLPTDRPRPNAPGFAGGTVRDAFSVAQTQALKAFSRAHGVTPFMTLLAVFDVLLHRYTGAVDLTVGVPVAGRAPAETAPLIGLFINTLVLRADLSGNPSFADLLQQVRAAALDAFSRQDVPFERLVEALQPTRALGHTPLFQVMFDYLNTPVPTLRLDGLEIESVRVQEKVATHDLSLLIHDESDRLQLTLEYDAALYDRATVERLRDHFMTFLDAVLTDPARPIGALPLLPAAEAARLARWSTGARLAPEVAAADPLAPLALRVAETPAAPAVFDMGSVVSYAELDARSADLATHLRRAGVGPGQVVALCLPRSVRSIVATLAVLRAGAAYLPLDPAWPDARLAAIAADAGAALVLTDDAGAARLGPAPVARLDADGRPVDGVLPSIGAPAVDTASGDDPAYIIYTSGSSGRPKGVAIARRSLAAFTASCVDLYALTAADRMLHFAAPAFDTTVEEIFPTLAAGGALVVWPARLPDSYTAFVDFVAATGVTVLDLPTAFWHGWSAELAAAERATDLLPPPAVRLVIVGGEAAQAAHLQTWRARVSPTVGWVNTYGPTEGTVVATAFSPGAAPSAEQAAIDAVPIGTVPIGTPLPHVDAFVLDPYGAPCPIGVPGELYLGGDGVALGYWRRPELTAAAFVTRVIDGVTHRLYRTGDRARWRPDGALAYLGRLDAQVKVRGFRVEPGEVEAQLMAQPAVARAAVMARHGALIAYVVPATGTAAFDATALAARLADQLPPFMVPARIVAMDDLPLTANNKLDRAALAALATRLSPAERQAPPATATEQTIADVWRELLERHAIGRHDDFFALGGHSLLAVRAVTRLRSRLGLDLPLAQLFETPTVAGLAEALDRPGADETAPAGAEREQFVL